MLGIVSENVIPRKKLRCPFNLNKTDKSRKNNDLRLHITDKQYIFLSAYFMS